MLLEEVEQPFSVIVSNATDGKLIKIGVVIYGRLLKCKSFFDLRQGGFAVIYPASVCSILLRALMESMDRCPITLTGCEPGQRHCQIKITRRQIEAYRNFSGSELTPVCKSSFSIKFELLSACEMAF